MKFYSYLAVFCAFPFLALGGPINLQEDDESIAAISKRKNIPSGTENRTPRYGAPAPEFGDSADEPSDNAGIVLHPRAAPHRVIRSTSSHSKRPTKTNPPGNNRNRRPRPSPSTLSTNTASISSNSTSNSTATGTETGPSSIETGHRGRPHGSKTTPKQPHGNPGKHTTNTGSATADPTSANTRRHRANPRKHTTNTESAASAQTSSNVRLDTASSAQTTGKAPPSRHARRPAFPTKTSGDKGAQATASSSGNSTNTAEAASRPTRPPSRGSKGSHATDTAATDTAATDTAATDTAATDTATDVTDEDATATDATATDDTATETADSTDTAGTADPTETSSSDDTSLTDDAPPYNLKNITCDDLNGLNASARWDAVDGDNMLQTFINMYNSDKLVCDQCFNQRPSDCPASDRKRPQCQTGINAQSKLKGATDPSWTVAAGLFAQNENVDDLSCDIGPNQCNVAASCDECNGPGSYAILKSLATAHNSFEANYEAIEEAGNACDKQMNAFSDTFAPLPDTEGEGLGIIIMTALIGGLAGFIPGVGGAAAGLATGLGAGIGIHEFYSHQPGPADTAGPLGSIVKAIKSAYIEFANNLFHNGEYTHKTSDGLRDVKITLQDLMSGGELMQQDADPKNYFSNLVPTYEKTLFQQLALITWQNLEKDGNEHVPFIAFDKGPCDKVDTNNKDAVGNAMIDGVGDLDVSVDFQGDCYYLLDAYPDSDPNSYSEQYPHCVGAHALPGGTHKDMKDNADTFADLSLEDFVIPSVLGWQNNSKQNGYKAAATNGNLIKDPQEQGVVNIPVCDFVGNREMPGVDCPKLDEKTYHNKKCDTVPASEGKNPKGVFQVGKCRAHVEQFQKDEGNTNLLHDYQVAVDVFDNSNRQIGQASKQSAAKPLEVVNANLPFNIIVVPGGTDDDPMNFWFADQYWDSNNKDRCSVGAYDSGSRKMDCTFDCGPPPEPLPVSATKDHPLPNPAVKAVAAGTSFVNTYVRPSATAPAVSATPTYKSGKCRFHCVQYQKNEGQDINPTNDYMVQLTFQQDGGDVFMDSGKISAPADKEVEIPGLKKKFIVKAGKVDSDPMHFKYDNFEFQSDQEEHCSEGKEENGFEDGNKDMDCNFDC
ncbi:MAG: hypothetical protein LQ351_004690 [Letrouitia transgressa]|nr:MAG: hypothetical protein LQ351_004690 [Letrouitia transgressa]